MKGSCLILLAAIVCTSLTGCNPVETMKDVSQISYTSDAGSILPELQWHEQIVITRDRLSLTRNGAVSETEVNAGSWEIGLDEQKVRELFKLLEAVDCSTIERVEPDDPPDGGHRESYTVVYARSRTCSLTYDPGVSYTNAERIVEPVKAFIQSVSLPAEATGRYKLTAP